MMRLPEGAWASSTEYQVVCPDCGGPRAFINPRKRAGHCKHGGCEWVAYSKQEIYAAFDIDEDDEDREFRGLKDKQFGRKQEHGYTLTGLVPAWVVPQARVYLQAKRGLSEPIVRKAGIGYTTATNHFVVDLDPYTSDLQPRQATRYYSGKGKWRPAYEGISLIEYCYGWRYLREDLKGIVLTEGVFDVLASRLLGYGIAMMGTEITLSGLHLLSRFERVVLWLDPDKAGKKFVKTYARQIQRIVGEVYILWERDPKFLRPAKRALDARIIKQLRWLCLTEKVHSCKLDLQIQPRKLSRGLFDVYTPLTPAHLRPLRVKPA